MVDQIKSKEDAERILKEKIGKFAEELEKLTDNFGGEAAKLLNSAKNGLDMDPKQRAKLINQLKSSINPMTTLWTYAGFALCVLIILLAFVYIGYYKLYKPMADKERKTIAKKQQKEQKKKSKKQV